MRSHLAATLAIISVLFIAVFSGMTIARIISSNAPPQVVFALGVSYRDMSYCNSQTLDLYVPRQAATRPLPLAVFVHGGGMTAGDKADINPALLNALASAGYAVASVNYRLAPVFKFPAQIEDVKCAIRFLRNKSAAFGLSSTDVFAFGTSVGGQLAALAALTGPRSAFDGPFAQYSSRIEAVVDLFGPVNLTEDAGFSSSDVQKVFPANYDLRLASPSHFVAQGAPPILIIQGVDDAKVPPAQSTELYNELRSAGDRAELVLVQNMGHMFAQVGPNPVRPSLGQIADDVVRFFNASEGGQ
jgi:acetyl esterase/lipase